MNQTLPRTRKAQPKASLRPHHKNKHAHMTERVRSASPEGKCRRDITSLIAGNGPRFVQNP